MLSLKDAHVKIGSVEAVRDGAFRTATIDCSWDAATGAEGLAMAIKEMCWAATEAVLQDHNILILSDRLQGPDRIPMPALLATAAVHHQLTRQVVNRYIEKTLHLGCVQVYRQHPVGPGRSNQICHQFRSNGNSTLVFSILTGVAKVRNNRSNTTGTGPSQTVQINQQLHQILINRPAGRLQNKAVPPANVILQLYDLFAVRKPLHLHAAERNVQILTNRTG
ncbi:hypothetical protein LCGC14_1164030 [marine sediment metagenome]|uniref:Glutamate synthase central-N domain-containing protein n=1 Tax=marine sediment metagenome TaxID=412755 RepID=A0A0F9MEW1_9ZZZZ